MNDERIVTFFLGVSMRCESVEDLLFDVTYRVSGETCAGGAVVVGFDN